MELVHERATAQYAADWRYIKLHSILIRIGLTVGSDRLRFSIDVCNVYTNSCSWTNYVEKSCGLTMIEVSIKPQLMHCLLVSVTMQ